MRVEVVNLGGGLHRIDTTPTIGEGRIPQSVTDNIMRDVIRREQQGVAPRGCTSQYVTTPTRCEHPHPSWMPTATRPVCPPRPNREPDGLDAHIDRPQRSNYGGIPWLAEDAYQRDLVKYRNAERAIKACEWPAREPMKGTEHLPQPTPRTQRIGIPAPQPRNFTTPQRGFNLTLEDVLDDWYVDDDDWF